jgi:predicted amidohydrolase
MSRGYRKYGLWSIFWIHPTLAIMFKLALAQMRVDGGSKTANVQRATARIATAAAAGAQVVLLPETLDLGWTHPAAKSEAEPIPEGFTCAQLRDAARRHSIYVCAGLVERFGQLVFNSAVLIGPAGQVLLHHRKLNELEIGHAAYAQGDRLAVVCTPVATFGLMICADAFARGQVVSRTLGLMGADVILSPCAWAVPANHDQAKDPYGQLWLDNYQPVARDFRIWIAAASNVGWLTAGPWASRKCIGCSMVIGPKGEIVATGPYGAEADTIIYADVSPAARPARAHGWEACWNERPT